MTPVPRIQGADLVSKVAETLSTREPAPVASPEAVQKFSALMDDRAGGAARAPEGGQNMISRLVQNEQDSIRGVEDHMRAFMQAAPGMSTAEVMAANVQLTHEMTLATTRFGLATTASKKSNDGFNSLLKNQ